MCIVPCQLALERIKGNSDSDTSSASDFKSNTSPLSESNSQTVVTGPINTDTLMLERGAVLISQIVQ